MKEILNQKKKRRIKTLMQQLMLN